MTYDSQQRREIIFLTEHFHPSTGATAQLITDLVEDLANAGISLRVLTSTPDRSSSQSYPVLRFSGSGHYFVGILGKLVAGLRFLIGSSIWLLLNTRAHHTLFIVSNPPFIGLIGPLMRFLRKTPYIFLLQDVFPRSASLTGVLPAKGPLIWIWRKIIQNVLTNSQATVVLSRSMIERCKTEFGPCGNLVAIPNWSVISPVTLHKHQNPWSIHHGLDDCFSIQYSGNFGRLHDLLTLLEGARLPCCEEVKFVFIGDGAKKHQILKYQKDYNLKNLVIMPYQARSDLPYSLSSSDVSVISLIPGAEDTVSPSKLYGILACGKPIILIASEDSELAQLIREARCGFVVGNGDVSGLVNAIVSLRTNPELLLTMGHNAEQLYQRRFGRLPSVQSYLNLFKLYNMI